ncbi:hypothetical protein HA630_06335, partial [Aquabacterium sp. A08]|nr:hypothetical protein [Aquabacterium sp. A08]
MTLLLLANLAFWAYTQGHLSGLGLAPDTSREPERLARQQAPDKLTLLNAAGTAPALASPPVPTPAEDAAGHPLTEPAPPDSAAPAPTAPPQATAAPAPNASPAAPPPVAGAQPPTACWVASGLAPSQTVLVRAALQNLPGL